jgi:hypothetical protein
MIVRKVFYGLGIVFATLLVAGGIGLFVLFRNGAALDRASETYVDDAVVSISSHWSKDELLKRASPEFMKAARNMDVGAFLDRAAGALGPLVDYEGAKGSSFMAKSIGGETTITGNYVASAKFAKGSAQFNISVRQIDGRWMIDGFQINSPEFMRALTGQGT